MVVPDYPHHVTQRGNRRQATFFSDADFRFYIELLVEAKVKAGVEILAYCLMPNHVHFVVVPQHKDSLSVLFSNAHRRYTRWINVREGWRGHLWQERFHSFVMDEHYLLAAVRYTELNPVRAGLVSRPEEWVWSSVHAHLKGEDDDLVTVNPMLEIISDWSSFLATPEVASELDNMRMSAQAGRPIGNDNFVDKLERITGCQLRRGTPGRKKRIN